MRHLPIIALVLLVLVAGFYAPLTTAPSSSSAPSAPLHPASPALSGAAAAPTAATPHTAPTCPTAQGLPDWTSPSFFNDVLVTFTVPGYTNLSGANFQTVPCENFLPTYLPGFWMNISTNVPISLGTVNIWGTLWPTPNQPLGDLPGFPYDQTTITALPMYIAPGAPEQASFWFNTARYFYPGSTVYFNVTLTSSTANPSTISSANELSQIVPAGSNLNATWSFSVNPPWWSPSFTSDIRVTTTPSVIGGAVYEPNINQSLNVQIESVGKNGAPSDPVPQAELTLNIMNDAAYDGTYGIPFVASNHTFQNLSKSIGPYPGAEIELNVSAWLPWEGGAIDLITGPHYWFNWSTQGGWPTPTQGLAANAVIATDPSVLLAGTNDLATGTPVNVSLSETTPNVTISSSVIRFHFTDTEGSISGILPMHLIGQQASYAILPGLPAGSHVTFSVLAKDVFENPLASGNYSYTESGNTSLGLGAFASYFYVEGINASTSTLLSGAAFTISNTSWSQSGVTNPLGFGLLIIPNGAGTLQLPYGRYTVTMAALGHVQTTNVTLRSPVPFTVRFWFANGPVASSVVVPLSSLTIGLVAGTIVLALALFPLYRWFEERQKKAEAERTRVTL
jgi:hypothetical protein